MGADDCIKAPEEDEEEECLTPPRREFENPLYRSGYSPETLNHYHFFDNEIDHSFDQIKAVTITTA